jgi:hypothetical protein
MQMDDEQQDEGAKYARTRINKMKVRNLQTDDDQQDEGAESSALRTEKTIRCYQQLVFSRNLQDRRLL